MKPQNKVFIATSLDGFIAEENGGLDWLTTTPTPENTDMGYGAFTAQIDALLMGRNTFDTVCKFDGEWPYQKPVFVLSNTLTEIPEKYTKKAELVQGDNLDTVLEKLHNKGFYRLYIDGGKLIQSFLREDRIAEMIITTIPLLLGAGIRLFGDMSKPLAFDCVATHRFSEKFVQQHYQRVR